MSITEKFKSLCYELYQGSTSADVRRHNRAMTKLEKMFKDIKNMPDKSFLISLMGDTDHRVRLSAAVRCLRMNIYIDEAVSVLEELTKIVDVLGRRYDTINVSFSAEMSLELFKKGKLI